MSKTRAERIKRVVSKHERRAERATKEYERRRKGADASEEATGIPLGQPILVGHHSERRHRAAIKRIDMNMRKAVEASKEVDEANRLATGAELALEGRNTHGAYGVSHRDSDAIELLTKKIAELESRRDKLKSENKALRKAKIATDDPDAAAKVKAALECTDNYAAAMVRGTQGWDKTVCHPGWEITNLTREIARTNDRLAELRALDNAPEFRIDCDGLTARSDAEARTIVLEFSSKPPEYLRNAIKGSGFRWIRSISAWSRKRCYDAEQAATSIAKRYFGWTPEEPRDSSEPSQVSESGTQPMPTATKSKKPTKDWWEDTIDSIRDVHGVEVEFNVKRGEAWTSGEHLKVDGNGDTIWPPDALAALQECAANDGYSVTLPKPHEAGDHYGSVYLAVDEEIDAAEAKLDEAREFFDSHVQVIPVTGSQSVVATAGPVSVSVPVDPVEDDEDVEDDDSENFPQYDEPENEDEIQEPDYAADEVEGAAGVPESWFNGLKCGMLARLGTTIKCDTEIGIVEKVTGGNHHGFSRQDIQYMAAHALAGGYGFEESKLGSYRVYIRDRITEELARELKTPLGATTPGTDWYAKVQDNMRRGTKVLAMTGLGQLWKVGDQPWTPDELVEIEKLARADGFTTIESGAFPQLLVVIPKTWDDKADEPEPEEAPKPKYERLPAPEIQPSEGFGPSEAQELSLNFPSFGEVLERMGQAGAAAVAVGLGTMNLSGAVAKFIPGCTVSWSGYFIPETLIAHAAKHAATETGRYALNHFWCEMTSAGRARLVATCGRRLAMWDIAHSADMKHGNPASKVLIPATLADPVTKLLAAARKLEKAKLQMVDERAKPFQGEDLGIAVTVSVKLPELMMDHNKEIDSIICIRPVVRGVDGAFRFVEGLDAITYNGDPGLVPDVQSVLPLPMATPATGRVRFAIERRYLAQAVALLDATDQSGISDLAGMVVFDVQCAEGSTAEGIWLRAPGAETDHPPAVLVMPIEIKK